MTLEELFPNLSKTGYRETSAKTRDYNCIAWAAGDDTRWWDALPGYYWPEEAPRSFTVAGMVKMFESRGYEPCTGVGVEEGYERVAVYGDLFGYSHAARQLPNGKWTSKIGGLQDIEHSSLDGLVGQEYGTVRQILRRKIEP